jgi:GT2 family glycosyltransferase
VEQHRGNESGPDITAIVVNYKTPELTNKAVASIFAGSPGIVKEVIVVDNASGDGSPEMIRSKWGDRITLIEDKRNLGFAEANNIAMRMAKGRYFFLLNSDAEAMGDGIEKMVGFADSNPRIGVVGCRIVSSSGQQQTSCWCTYNLAFLLCRALNLYRVFPNGAFGSINIEEYGKPQKTCAVEVVSGCAMLVRSAAADQVGLFDGRFFMYCEDMDWCTRMHKAGYEVYFFRDATVVHLGGGTNPYMRYHTLIEQNRSVLKFMLKEYGIASAFLANILLALFFIIRLPYWLAASVAGKNRAHARRVAKAYAAAPFWHLLWPICSRS